MLLLVVKTMVTIILIYDNILYDMQIILRGKKMCKVTNSDILFSQMKCLFELLYLINIQTADTSSHNDNEIKAVYVLQAL